MPTLIAAVEIEKNVLRLKAGSRAAFVLRAGLFKTPSDPKGLNSFLQGLGKLV